MKEKYTKIVKWVLGISLLIQCVCYFLDFKEKDISIKVMLSSDYAYVSELCRSLTFMSISFIVSVILWLSYRAKTSMKTSLLMLGVALISFLSFMKAETLLDMSRFEFLTFKYIGVSLLGFVYIVYLIAAIFACVLELGSVSVSKKKLAK